MTAVAITLEGEKFYIAQPEQFMKQLTASRYLDDVYVSKRNFSRNCFNNSMQELQ